MRPDGTIAKGYTFNAWEGCAKVAPGCKNCYAETRANRFGQVEWGPHGTRMLRADKYWREPLKWNAAAEKVGERRRVFCSSLADVFEDWGGRVIDHRGEPSDRTIMQERRRLFDLIDATPALDWLLLTKRPENIRDLWACPTCPYCDSDPCERLDECSSYAAFVNNWSYRPNVWLLTSVSDQATADAAIPELLKCRALSPVLGVSAEPLLGPIDFDKIGNALFDRDRAIRKAMNGPQSLNSDQADSVVDYPMLDWVIAGGESGPGARPYVVDYAADLIRQCRTASVPVFHKQLGAMPVTTNANLWDFPGEPKELAWGDYAASCRYQLSDKKGGDPSEWSEDLRVRQFPQLEATV